MIQKINLTEIVPANDVLKEELENVRGGEASTHLCLKGCVTGDSAPNKDHKDKNNPKLEP